MVPAASSQCRKLIFLLVSCGAATAQARTYHVSVSGDDAARGSISAPFRTIQRCADVAVPGDACSVHSGTYRETVTPPRSGTENAPIRFEASAGECVTVSGADPLTGTWAQHIGAIWKVPMQRTVVQLFAEGAMLVEARWPNADPADLVHMPFARAGLATTATALDVTAAPIGDWTNAQLVAVTGLRWQGFTRRIAQYDPTTRLATFDSPIDVSYGALTPRYGDPYYLFGSLVALDTEGEWFYDSDAKQLFLWAPGGADPNQLTTLEYKRRSYAFDLNALTDVQIVGFQVFAGAIRLNSTERCTVDGVRMRYVNHAREIDGANTVGATNLVHGKGNVWKNSVIAQSATSGLVVQGNDNRIINNIVHDIAYQPSARSGIEVTADITGRSERNWIVHNTVFRSGGSAIHLGHIGGSKAGRVLFNRAYDVALQVQDLGIISSWNLDGEGTEVAYNELSDIYVEYGAGVYLDAGSKRCIIHHNYIHDSLFYAANLCDEHLFFNNTMERIGASAVSIPNGVDANIARLELFNNLYASGTGITVRLHTHDVADWGDHQAFVMATAEWSHVEVPFSSLLQPLWAKAVPLDLRVAEHLSFSSRVMGDVVLEIDNMRFEGDTGELVAAFEHGTLNTESGLPLAAYAGTGSTAELSLTTEGANGSAGAARLIGHWIAGGDASMSLPLGIAGSQDLSSYRGISFDVRATSVFELAAPSATPHQSHNAVCPLDAQPLPTNDCAIDQGEPMPPFTDDFAGGAPDMGAFESGRARFVVGAQFEESESCERPKDAVFTMLPAATYPDMQSPAPMRAEGCSCHIATSKRSASSAWVTCAALLVIAHRRRSLRRSKPNHSPCCSIAPAATGLLAMLFIGCGGSTTAGPSDAGSPTPDASTTVANPCDPKPGCATSTPTPGPCSAVAPTDALITDWSNVGSTGMFLDGDVCTANPPAWWEQFFGGPWISPSLPDACASDAAVPAHYLTQDFSSGAWHVTGTVAGWSGMGLWFGPCMIDMSAFDGISFTIAGNVGPSGNLRFTVAASNNHAPDPVHTNVGTCNSDCRDAGSNVAVSSMPTRATLLWSDLTGGSPSSSPDPSGIVGMTWAFDTTSAVPYDVDVTIDDIRLVVGE